MHPIFEAVYVPAFIKAANANGRVFSDLEDLGAALKLAAEKRAFLGRAANLVRGALGASRGGALAKAQGNLKAMGQHAADMRYSVPKGSRAAAAIQAGGGAGLRRQVIPMRGGKPVGWNNAADRQAVQGALNKQYPVTGAGVAQQIRGGGFGGQVRGANLTQGGNLAAGGPANINKTVLQNMHAQNMIQANHALRKSMPAQMQNRLAKGHAELQRLGGHESAYQAGQAARPALASAAKGVGVLGGAGLAGAGIGMGVPAALSPNAAPEQKQVTAGARTAELHAKIARLKVAARVINADVGLDQIINHMKKARAKKVLAQSTAGS